MVSRRVFRWRWWVGLMAIVALPVAVMAQLATKSDADLIREGPAALAAAHGDKPRYGGKFISTGNEVIPLFDMHQTSFGGVYAATASAYNCLIRTSPYDPMALDIVPELDEMEIHIITDPQAMAAAVLSKRVFWTDAFPHPSLDQDLGKSMVKQNPNLVLSNVAVLGIASLTMQTEKAPFDDVRVRQAISEGIRREALAELGKQTGLVGTGTYPAGPWAMPREMREQLIGYGSDMLKRITHAKELLAAYEKEKGKIDWSKIKIQCSTNLPVTC